MNEWDLSAHLSKFINFASLLNYMGEREDVNVFDAARALPTRVPAGSCIFYQSGRASPAFGRQNTFPLIVTIARHYRKYPLVKKKFEKA